MFLLRNNAWRIQIQLSFNIGVLFLYMYSDHFQLEGHL